MKKAKFFCCPTFSIKSNLCKGKMYVLDGNGVKCECVITDEGNNILEIKNTEVSENAVVAGETAGFEKRRSFQNRHVFRSRFGGVDYASQRILRPNTVHVLLSVQHAALAGDTAETPFFPADGQMLILDALRLKAGVYQADFEFLEVPELRHVGLIVHFETLLQKCEKPERPVTLRLFKVMRFEYKKAPHSNRVRCLECVDKKDAGAKSCVARVCGLLRLDFPFLQFEPPASCDDG